MNEQDDLARSLRMLASTAADDASDLLPAVHRRADALRRRRRSAASGTVAMLVVACVVGGVGLAGRPGSPRTTPLASSQDDAPALAACSVPGHLAAPPTAEKSRAPEAQAKEAADANTEGKPADQDPTPNSRAAKGRAVIENVNGHEVTFRFEGDFGGDPSRATADRPIGATIDDQTQWLDAGRDTDPRTLGAGDLVGLAVIDDGDGVRLKFIETDPDRIDADATDLVATKGTVRSWAPDQIVIDVDDPSGRSSLTAIPEADTETFDGETRCTPTSLPVGTPVAVKVKPNDDGTWQLLALSY